MEVFGRKQESSAPAIFQDVGLNTPPAPVPLTIKTRAAEIALMAECGRVGECDCCSRQPNPVTTAFRVESLEHDNVAAGHKVHSCGMDFCCGGCEE